MQFAFVEVQHSVVLCVVSGTYASSGVPFFDLGFGEIFGLADIAVTAGHLEPLRGIRFCTFADRLF